MSAPVFALRPDDSVHHARNEMVSRGVSKFPVVEDGDEVVGMLTKSDLVFSSDHHLNPSRRSPLQDRFVREVMSDPTWTVEGTEDLERIVPEMLSRNVGAVPVVNGRRSLAGLLTETDVLRHLEDDLRGKHRVRDLMTTDVTTVHPQASLSQAIQRMEEGDFHQVPVMEDGGTLVGILTLSDIVFSDWFEPGPRSSKRVVRTRRDEPGRKDRETSLDGVVRDAMREEVRTLEADQDVVAALHLMQQFEINALPVMDDDGAVEGILSRTDVLRAWSQEHRG